MLNNIMPFFLPYVNQKRPLIVLFLLWLLVMIVVPIVGWTRGEEAMRHMMIVGVLCQATVVLAILKTTWSWQKLGRIFLFIATTTLAIEAIGTATGYPFGRYVYTDFLQPQLFHVPLLIPLAWFMMLPVAWAVMQRQRTGRTRFALTSALAFTAWDLFLDPQMVMWSFWIWEKPGFYFGIPLLNYVGWIATAFVITWLLYPLTMLKRNAQQLLWLVYAITWFLETVGLAFFWGQHGPALVGTIIMGAFMLYGRLPIQHKP